MATIKKTTRATVNAIPAVLVFSTYQLQYLFASRLLNQNNMVPNIEGGVSVHKIVSTGPGFLNQKHEEFSGLGDFLERLPKDKAL